MNAYDVGMYGESVVKQMLAGVGEAHKVKQRYSGDINFLGCKIEVKTARMSQINGRKDKGFQFCLFKEKGTDFRHSDILVLLALDEHLQMCAAWVIPTDRLGNRHKISIPLDLSGKWAYWLNQWEVIADYIAEA